MMLRRHRFASRSEARFRWPGVIWLLATLFTGGPSLQGQSVEQLLSQGQQLFEKEWEAGPRADGQGDGLGPLFNDRSCVACHFQGGIGGGGPLKNNVDVMSARDSNGELSESFDFAEQLRAIHPAFLNNRKVRTAFVFHRQGIDPRYAAERERFLMQPAETTKLAPELLQRQFSLQPIRYARTGKGLYVFLAQRNSSSLFGAGLIDAIPDELLVELADVQARDYPGISGRSPVTSTGLGKFGWRASTAHLSEFVSLACSAELGLSSAGRNQPTDFISKRTSPKTPDVMDAELEALTAFVAALPAPRPQIPRGKTAALIENGHQVFERVGCAACHVQHVGPAKNIFSDLLLHDMGYALADPAAAMANETTVDIDWEVSLDAYIAGEPVLTATPSITVNEPLSSVNSNRRRVSITDYYDTPNGPPPPRRSPGSAVVYRETKHFYDEPKYTAEREYRTSPLWGVKDTAPYLHDGRASTLVEAVAYHGGEAASSRDAFFALGSLDQEDLLAFLDTLRMPGR